MKAGTQSWRVLHVVGYPHRMGGSQRSLLELVTHYPHYAKAHIVLPSDGAVALAFREHGVKVTVLESSALLASSGRVSGLKIVNGMRIASALVPVLGRLADLMLREDIDVVHTNDPRATVIAGPVARALGLPLVAHLRAGRAFSWPLWHGMQSVSSRIISVSEDLIAELRPRVRRKAVVVHSSVSAARPGTTIPWLSGLREEGVVVVVTLASLVPRKGIHHLIDALALLNARGWRKRMALVCVGDVMPCDAWYGDLLNARCLRLGVDNLTITGWHSDPFPFLRSADIVVLASVGAERLLVEGRSVKVLGSEGLPRVLLEAHAYGLPTVAAMAPGVREVVDDGVTGLVVPAADPALLADAIESLAMDRTSRERMGAAAAHRAEMMFGAEKSVMSALGVLTSMAPSRRLHGLRSLARRWLPPRTQTSSTPSR